MDDAEARSRLLQQYGLEIGAGLGAMAGKIWHIGLMGTSCNHRNVILCLGALEGVLGRTGAIEVAKQYYRIPMSEWVQSECYNYNRPNIQR